MTEVEAKLIATALIIEPKERELLLRRMNPVCFSDPLGQETVTTLQVLNEKYPNADYTALLDSLPSNIKQHIVEVLSSLITPTIAQVQIDDTLHAFQENQIRRLLKERITSLAFGKPTVNDIRQLAEFADQLVTKETEHSGRNYLRTYTEPVPFIPTGFSNLDRVLNGGFLRGTLVSIGARPSTGKTTFSLNIATHCLSWKVLFISIEMSAGMLYDRIVADKADADYNICSLHQLEYSLVEDIVGKLDNLKIVDEMNKIEAIEDIIYTCKPDVIIIDYIQILASEKRFIDNRQRIDYISQRLKKAAKKNRCVIIILSQITRNGKDKPTMSDLKESGGLEQDSDYVLLLHRPYVSNKANAKLSPKDTILSLDKNKFGSTCELDMLFLGERQRFVESCSIIRSTDAERTDDDLPFK